VKNNNSGFEINSVIIGEYKGIIYQVEYQIKTNPSWQTVQFQVKSQHSNQTDLHRFESDGKGNWLSNGKQCKQFEGCIDIDIPLTPFTNTLPINRLQLKHNEEHQIKVIYLDLLEQQVKPVYQKYKRLSDTEYHYQNVPNDFEATIEVDASGLVVKYPGLFTRTAIL
jgi:hypothetical protein